MSIAMAVSVPDTYWVEPGKVLAGAHPASRSRADTIRRLKALIAAGITVFLDLTESGEHVPYVDLLNAVAGRRSVRHIRKPLIDHQVPQKREIMLDILQTLQSLVAEGECVYLHCRAGIGRTGIVAGCYLIHCGGMQSDHALEHLQELWERSGRIKVWPQTPETEEQTEYVRKWSMQKSASWWKPWG